MVVEFKNEPGYDFSVQENVDMFKKDIERRGKRIRSRHTISD